MNTWLRYTMLPALALVAVFGLAACDDDDDDGNGGADAGADAGMDDGGNGDDGGVEMAMLRVIHLSPDAPAVDVYVQGEETPVVEGLDFTSTTDYLELDPGTYTFEVTPAGDPDTVVLTLSDVAVGAGEAYTAAAYGEATADPATLAGLLLVDDLTEVAAGQARVRPVHVAVGVGPVDVTVTNSDGSISVPLPTLDFGEAGDAFELPTDTVTAEFDVDADGVADVTFSDIEVIDQSISNVYAVSDADGAVFLLAQFADGTTETYLPDGAAEAVNVRPIHLSPDAPAVDVYGATDPPILGFENLAFGESGSYLEVPLGIGFLVVPNGADPTDPASVVLELDAAELPLVAGGYYTAAVYGEAGAEPTDPTALAPLLLEDDVTPPASGNGRVTPVHAAVGLADIAVDVYEVSAPETAIVEDLAYGQVGPALELPAGDYSLGFDANDDPTVFEVVFDVSLMDGQLLNGYAATNPDGVTNLYLQDNAGEVQVVAPSAPAGP